MEKFETGRLKSGRSGKPVTSRKQAIAIMLSERRNEEATGSPDKTPRLHVTRKKR